LPSDIGYIKGERIKERTANQLDKRQTGSKAEEIDAVLALDEVDVENQRRASDCFVTYAETIEAHQDETAGARRNIPREAVFEIYQEAHKPPLKSLFEGFAE
jgi:hypothetical protein